MEAVIEALPEGYPPQAIWKSKTISGKWVIGFPLFDNTIVLVPVECTPRQVTPLPYVDIDPTTLSQCTGFADKNAKMIFFGDAYLDDWSMWVVFDNGGAINALSNEGWVDSLTDLGRLSGIEITGNIHETEGATP